MYTKEKQLAILESMILSATKTIEAAAKEMQKHLEFHDDNADQAHKWIVGYAETITAKKIYRGTLTKVKEALETREDYKVEADLVLMLRRVIWNAADGSLVNQGSNRVQAGAIKEAAQSLCDIFGESDTVKVMKSIVGM